MGKIINFPISLEQQNFIETSHLKLQALIQSLNMAHEKQFLDRRIFQELLNYCGINPAQDLYYIDLAILQFHIDNYYELDISL